jgi:hypothetical protein
MNIMKNTILSIIFASLCSLAFGQLFTSNPTTLQFGSYTGNFGMGDNPKPDNKLYVKGSSAWSNTASILAETTSPSIFAKAIEGQSPNGVGVFGKSDAGHGVYAFSQTGIAFKAHSQAGSAALFDGNVSIKSGGLLLSSLRGNTSGDISFQYDDNGTLKTSMLVQQNGKIGIGNVNTAANGFRLFVEGGIATGRIKVDQSWADYVFDDDYDMESLDEVASFIETHGHLPNVPSQASMEANGGFEVGAMMVKQQEKIEEIFLHLIEMQTRIDELETALDHTVNVSFG